jgi:hypothetical protein
MYIGRMSRWDWLERVAPLVKLGKPRPKREQKPKAQLKTFTTKVYGYTHTFSAYTKSEARSMLKKVLAGVIPVGTVFIEVN